MKMTYIGRRMPTGKSKTVHAFIAEDATDDEYTFWPKAKSAWFAGVQIGGIYDLEQGATEGSTKFPARWTQIRVGRAPDADCQRWEGEDRAAVLIGSESSVDMTPELTRAIRALNTAKRAFPMNKRVMFDAWLLNQLR